MNNSIKTLACAIMASIAFFACNDTGLNGSVSSQKTKTNSSIEEIPTMDSRVVSYKRNWMNFEYEETLGFSKSGFTTDKNILKSMFPNIFKDEQAESECNYFALYSGGSSTITYYMILSQDMTINSVMCTRGEKPFPMNDDLVYQTMLICDDKAGTLRKNINLDSVRIYTVPDWKCGSDIGGLNIDEIFF